MLLYIRYIYCYKYAIDAAIYTLYMLLYICYRCCCIYALYAAMYICYSDRDPDTGGSLRTNEGDHASFKKLMRGVVRIVCSCTYVRIENPHWRFGLRWVRYVALVYRRQNYWKVNCCSTRTTCIVCGRHRYTTSRLITHAIKSVHALLRRMPAEWFVGTAETQRELPTITGIITMRGS